MIDWVKMSDRNSLDISGYLNRKFRERVTASADNADKPIYTKAQFARDIDLGYDTLISLMNNDEGATKMEFWVLQKLVAHFGRDFTDEMGLTPPDLAKKR